MIVVTVSRAQVGGAARSAPYRIRRSAPVEPRNRSQVATELSAAS
jgi:hypothetical protein